MNLPAYAPVEVWTFGTPPVRSTSLTTTAGDSDGAKSAMIVPLWVNFVGHNTIVHCMVIFI